MITNSKARWRSLPCRPPLDYGSGMTRFALPIASLLAGSAFAVPASAQLLEDRVVGDQRICIYVGSDQTADGQIVPRNSIVRAGQPCPTTAPYRDPNRPVPGNAILTGEATENSRRVCTYSQGGVTYTRAVPIARYCAMTPDLLDRAAAEVRGSTALQSSGRIP